MSADASGASSPNPTTAAAATGCRRSSRRRRSTKVHDSDARLRSRRVSHDSGPSRARSVSMLRCDESLERGLSEADAVELELAEEAAAAMEDTCARVPFAPRCSTAWRRAHALWLSQLCFHFAPGTEVPPSPPRSPSTPSHREIATARDSTKRLRTRRRRATKGALARGKRGAQRWNVDDVGRGVGDSVARSLDGMHGPSKPRFVRQGMAAKALPSLAHMCKQDPTASRRKRIRGWSEDEDSEETQHARSATAQRRRRSPRLAAMEREPCMPSPLRLTPRSDAWLALCSHDTSWLRSGSTSKMASPSESESVAAAAVASIASATLSSPVLNAPPSSLGFTSPTRSGRSSTRSPSRSSRLMMAATHSLVHSAVAVPDLASVFARPLDPRSSTQTQLQSPFAVSSAVMGDPLPSLTTSLTAHSTTTLYDSSSPAVLARQDGEMG